MILTRTPFRLSFFGGGTDYNSWFEKNKGLIIGSTFNKYNYISLRKLPPFFEHKSRIVYSRAETVNDNSQIEHPAVRNCLKFMNITDGLEIHYDGDLPARSGIGSSSSFTVGFLNALFAYQGKMVSRMDLAKMAIHVEQDISKENVGIQDQILTCFGGINVIEMGPGNNFQVSPLILPTAYRKELQSHMMLAFSGLTRNSSDTAGKQIEKISKGSIDDQMKGIYDIAVEGLSLFKRNAEIREIGKLIDKTWQVKRTLTSEVSNDLIDQVYNAAIDNGAYGGRLLGAGGGGFLMLIAPPHKQEQIKRALSSQIKVWVPFEFENEGAKILHYDSEDSAQEGQT
jgi:D-glycero-alpha-D-manno-heptose-7-phosphate kinase